MIQAVILDFDGVLVDSVDVKTEAFRALFFPYGAEITDRLVAYHLAHGGVSRFEKFRYAFRELLGKPLSAEEEVKLGERFSQLVEERVFSAPYLPGAMEFLHSTDVPLYVASGTPETELRRIMSRRGLDGHFSGIFGAPATKSQIIRRILTENRFAPQRVIMVGDSTTDFLGAQEPGVHFVGYVNSSKVPPFPPNVPMVSDLRDLGPLLAEFGHS